MKRLLLLFPLLLCGCINTMPKYTESEISSGELASVSGKHPGLFRDGFAAWINTVYNSNGEKVIDHAMLGNRMSKVHLPAGRYVFIMDCDGGYATAFPRLLAELERGKSYEIECHVAEREKDFLGINMIKSIAVDIKEIQTDREKPSP